MVEVVNEDIGSIVSRLDRVLNSVVKRKTSIDDDFCNSLEILVGKIRKDGPALELAQRTICVLKTRKVGGLLSFSELRAWEIIENRLSIDHLGYVTVKKTEQCLIR